MAPKKSKKISLNEFLGDNTLGSWADEMDSLPNAPAARTDQENAGDRFERREDYLNSRPDRQLGPPREDIPIPTQPPYTAFVGNLAFDLTEDELEQFFSGVKTKSVKIIKSKDEKPKGFGYIEFDNVEGLKDALSKTGSSFSGRTIRVSVAEPPKEKSGFGGFSSEDNAKFDNPWRRDGPLPDLPHSRDASRRRFDPPSNDRPLSSLSESPEDWRSSRPSRVTESSDTPPFKHKSSGLLTEIQGPADKEEVWTIGGKFKPTPNGLNEELPGKYGRTRGDMGPPKEAAVDESDWRSTARTQKVSPRSNVSPNSSTPSTPQLARKKLELLPRSGNASTSPSPLPSPKMGPSPPVTINSRGSPFGAARPVDVSSREKEVADRLERDREANIEKIAMSRSDSRTGRDRNLASRPQTPPASKLSTQTSGPPTLTSTVRPSLSFANVAAKKEGSASRNEEAQMVPGDSQ
jgi:translation initiation factor 4B